MATCTAPTPCARSSAAISILRQQATGTDSVRAQLGYIVRGPLTCIAVAEGPNLVCDVVRYLDARRRSDLRSSLVSAMASRLRCLPVALQTAVADLIDRGELPRSGTDLMRGLGVNARTADRSMYYAGMGSVHRVIAIAQAVRAYELLQHHELTLSRIAAHVGFAAVRPLDMLVRLITGMHLRDLRDLQDRRPADVAPLVLLMLDYLSAGHAGPGEERAGRAASRADYPLRSAEADKTLGH